MTGKAPAVAKRIFETLSDAQAYADDVNDSAIAGLQLSVINDEDPSKNGVYFVKSIGDGTNSAVLELIGEIPEVDLSEYAKTKDVETSLHTLEENLPTFGNGLEKTDNQVGIKIDNESEGFLSTSEDGLKISGIQQSTKDVFNDYLNTQGFTSKVVYLRESEWESLKTQVELGNKSWENNVIYMVYSDD